MLKGRLEDSKLIQKKNNNHEPGLNLGKCEVTKDKAKT